MNKLKMLLGVVVVVLLVIVIVVPFGFKNKDEVTNEDSVVIGKEVSEKKSEFNFKNIDDKPLEVATVEVEKVNEDKDKEEVTSESEDVDVIDVEVKEENTQNEKGNKEGKTGKVVVKDTPKKENKPVKKEEPKKEIPKKEEKPKQPVVTTKNVTETESIPFKTITEEDNTLEKGKTVVVQEGKNGVKTITYQETYVDGKFSSKKVVSEKVTKNPVNKIVKVGTKEVKNEPKPSNPDFEAIKRIYQENGYTVSGNVNDFVVSKNGKIVQTYSERIFGIWDAIDINFNPNHSAINTASKVLVKLGVPLNETQIKNALVNLVGGSEQTINGVSFSASTNSLWVRW